MSVDTALQRLLSQGCLNDETLTWINGALGHSPRAR